MALHAVPFFAANLAAENLESQRHGASKATNNIDGDFWAKLGGEGRIKSKEEAGEVLPKISPVGEVSQVRSRAPHSAHTSPHVSR